MPDLIQNNLALEESLDKQGTRLYNLENLNIPHKVSQAVDEIVTDAVDWAMQSLLRAGICPRTPPGSPPSKPPPPPPPAGTSGGKAPSSSKTAASASQSLDWTTFDTIYESAGAYETQELSPNDSLMHDDSIPEEQRKDQRLLNLPGPFFLPTSKMFKTIGLLRWLQLMIPQLRTRYLRRPEITTFMKWYCRQVNKTELTQPDFKGQSYEVVKDFYLDVIHLQFQMEKCHKMLIDQVYWANPEGDQVKINVNRPLPLGGPPVPEQMWIDDVCTYDVSEKYGISHWWFTRQKFYIYRHDSPSRRKDVKTHMRILSVIRIKAYFRYGYDYLSEIVLRRADHQEHTIAEKDFKNMYPSDFEDLDLLLLQGHLDHLFGSDKQMLSTAVKLWTRNLVIRQRVEDFQLVVFSVNNNERKIMQFNEIYKFSDGTLTRILETLDYRVKEFKIKRLNPGMNTRFWTEKDVTRSKEFIMAIERRQKTRRIYRNLECFIGGRVLDIDYRLLQRTE
ncbi:hypothetical protein Tco_0509133 [Tanacetum coccineum]